MRKHWKTIALILAQLLLFYVLPLAAVPGDEMGLVFLLILATFVLAVGLGAVESSRLKYLFPVLTAVLFLPTIFIYYNESALIQSVWYLVISLLGTGTGSLIQFLCRK